MIKKTGKYFVVLLALLAGWIAINSIDEPPRYDQSLLLPDVNIPDEQNGFAVLRYLDQDYDKDILISGKDYQQLRKMTLEWEGWDPEFAKRILEKNSALLDQIPTLVTRPYFKITAADNMYQSLPQIRLYQVAWLNLLKSRAALEKDGIDDAISTAHLTLLFCEKISLDVNGNMSSYLIGKACVGNVLNVYHIMASNHVLSSEQFRRIQSSIDSIAPYDRDGLSDVIRGDFTNTLRMATTWKTHSLLARWKEYTDYLRQMAGKNVAQGTMPSTVDKVYAYLTILFPDYYFHVNHMFNNIDETAKDVIIIGGNYCDSRIKKQPSGQTRVSMISGRTLKDLFMPDSLGALWGTLFYKVNDYNDFAIRRCESYNYFSAIKTNIAATQYQRDHGRLPDSLQALVPEYLLALPLDYFSGKSLLYSRTNGWLYSEGIEHNDHCGSTLGFYKARCYPSDNNNHSLCSTTPTFPINWNDYKFYEALHKAEAGDASAQNELGWMYQYGKYTSLDTQKAIEWYSKAAEQNYSSASWHLGDIYADNHSPFHDDTKAMAWYKKCHEQGCVYGSTSYADYLLSGDAGITDFYKATEIFIGLANKNSTHYAWEWLSALSNHMKDINTEITKAAWLDYFINHPDLVYASPDNPNEGIPEIHRRLGYYYRWEARNHIPDNAPPNAYNKLLDLALEHYRQAGDAENITELEKETRLATSTPTIQKNQPDPLLCKALQQGNPDLLAMQKIQTQIFKNPAKANSLAKLFHNDLNSRYPASAGGNQVGDTLDLSFESIDLRNITEVYFDFMYGDKAPLLEFGPGINDTRIFVKFDKQTALPTFSLLLASYGVVAECRSDSIRFTIADAERAKPHLFTPHFITQWDSVLYNGTTLSGTGHINYEDTFHYRGEIANALPNGTGIYSDSGNTNPEHYFLGDHFVGGVLYGHGVRVVDRLVTQEGQFEANKPVFPNMVGYSYSCEVIPEIDQGIATETHYDCSDSKYRQYFNMAVHSTLPPLWQYYGEYRDGKKTTGTCSVYKDAKIADTFHCEFYNNSLIRIDDILLLPPGMTIADLRQYH